MVDRHHVGDQGHPWRPYVHMALGFPAVPIVYYLVWKYLIGFFTCVARIAE